MVLWCGLINSYEQFFVFCVFRCLCFNRFGSWALVEGVADRLVVIGILFCKFEFFLAGCSVGIFFFKSGCRFSWYNRDTSYKMIKKNVKK